MRTCAVISPPSLADPPKLGRLHFTLSHPVLAWQAEEAVASLPLRMPVHVHCGHRACAQHGGVHARGTPAALN
jgi:hypothetical protein